MAATPAWLDDLSEDWNPPPANLPTNSRPATATSTKCVDTDNRASQTRIPRPNGGSIANKSLPRRRGSILSERSMSENNISREAPRTGRKTSVPVPSLSRSLSTSSLQSTVQCDTIERRSLSKSPSKKDGTQSTPEWKRRLLGKNRDSAEQADLFSPVGLERIFKNPPQTDISPQKDVKRGVSFLQSLDAMPSSPPPWPSSLPRAPNRSLLDISHEPSELRPVEEADEDDTSCDTFRADHARRGRALKMGDHSLEVTRSDQDGSSRSDIRHEGFSPVIISTRTASNGELDCQVQGKELSQGTQPSQAAEQPISNHIKSQKNNKRPSSPPPADTSFPEDLEMGTPELPAIGEFVTFKRGGFSDIGSFRTRPLSLSHVTDLSDFAERFSPIAQDFSSPPSDLLPPGFNVPARYRKASSVRSSHLAKTLSARSCEAMGLSQPGLFSTSITMPKTRIQDHDRPAEVLQESSLEDSTRHIPRGMDGKRPRSSPDKEGTCKRRKTIHEEDFSEISKSALANIQARHETTQLASARKRKDARHDSTASQADPQILAQRQILRPRNPTPSQRRGVQPEIEIQEASTLDFSDMATVDAVQEQLESMVIGGSSPAPLGASMLPEPIARMTIKAAKRMQEEGRKRSYTTQDYLDEAMQIMSKLRAGRRPESGLGSVQESTAEQPSADGTELVGNLENLTLSRPPSREGATAAWREPVREHFNPEVEVRLRRFRERENTEFTINSSLGSLRLTTGQGNHQNQPDASARSQSGRESPVSQVDAHNGTSVNESEEAEEHRVDLNGSGTVKTLSAPQSWDSSTGRTIGTNSTRRSEAIATLAPKAVAHLIPEQVAGMSFDHEKRIWVKDRSLTRDDKDAVELSGTEQSDQDPLGEIPDLSVDEIKEKGRKETYAHGNKVFLQRFVEVIESPKRSPEKREDYANPSQETVTATPHSRDGATITFNETGAASPKIPHVTLGTGVIDEPRASLGSTQQPAVEDKWQFNQERPVNTSNPSSAKDEDVEHEIPTTHERVSDEPYKRFRQVTVSFSSPLIQRTSVWSRSATGHNQKAANGENIDIVKQRHSLSAASRSAQTKLSNCRSRLNHPLAGVQEQEEWSLLPVSHVSHELSFQVNISSQPNTPEKNHLGNELCVPIAAQTADATLYLSDLPEFSFHQDDQRRPSERVLAQGLALYELRQANNPYAETIKDLVRELTNEQPEELYWDELQQLDLHGRRLTALHGLDDFCPGITNLDISENAVRDLTGAPMSIRHLDAQKNTLSSLTAWSFLKNLQYLDISGNQVDSLEGLGCLIHLRELKADSNDVATLDGVRHLNGLQKLSLRQNKIESIELDYGNLKQLSELDVSQNRVSLMRGLERLPQLETLRLDDNQLKVESFACESPFTYRELSTLTVARNSLESLPIALLPKLKVLLADENMIPIDYNVSVLEHLEVFSLRAQKLKTTPQLDWPAVTFPDAEVRELSLSANRISTFAFRPAMFDLRRLELAGCGICKLPPNLGSTIPNVRYLNLNSNAIKGIEPLVAMKKLCELHLAGNRLSCNRRMMSVIVKIANLIKADFRENPLTVGFYSHSNIKATSIVLKDTRQEQDYSDAHVWGPASKNEDRLHRARLDKETLLRRKVYELLLGGNCHKLQILDGLDFDAQEATSRDGVWDRLVDTGMMSRRVTSIRDFAKFQV
ncbi:MAG: hypothetical protein M1820_000800 [Bogoriella megaspora]|nr:MAG: hypothetical protein M1820_000800 [Bogoriella megaspora]